MNVPRERVYNVPLKMTQKKISGKKLCGKTFRIVSIGYGVVTENLNQIKQLFFYKRKFFEIRFSIFKSSS